jgi:hypothetical protein
MPRPNRGDVHVHGLLGNMAVKFILGAHMFVTADVFPIVPVDKQSDNYVVYDKGDFLRDEAEERAPATESAGGNYDIDTTPYYLCRTFSFHKDVDDDTRDNADKPIDPDRDAMQFTMQKLLIKRERQFLGNYLKAGVWSTNYTGVTGEPGASQFKKWSASGSKPVKDVDVWMNAVEEKTGMRPNRLVLSPDVMSALKDNEDIIGRIQYTQRGIITPEILASLFEVEKVLVARGTYNTAAKGAATAMSRMASGQVLLAYAADRPSTENPSAGYVFAWKGRFGNSRLGSRIKKFRMEHLDSDRVEAELSFDPKLVASDLAVYASAVV